MAYRNPRPLPDTAQAGGSPLTRHRPIPMDLRSISETDVRRAALLHDPHTAALRMQAERRRGHLMPGLPQEHKAGHERLHVTTRHIRHDILDGHTATSPRIDGTQFAAPAADKRAAPQREPVDDELVQLLMR